jgi:hypothetical protein
MIQAIKERVIVKPAGTIEIHCPSLPPRTAAEVIVMVEDRPGKTRPLTSFIGKAKGCFRNAAEVDAFIRAERDAWER